MVSSCRGYCNFFNILQKCRDFGWKAGKIKYLVLGYIIPVFYCIIAYGIFWSTGLGTFNGPVPDTLVIFIIIRTFGSIISALGEEIGWRGFLVPQLAKLTTFTKVAVISGIIGAIWHFPLIIFSNYNSATPLWYALPMFLVSVLGISFILAWLRLKSGSIWPAVLLHAGSNLYVQNIFDPLSGGSLIPYLVGENGILVVGIILIIAFIFWTRRDKLQDMVINGS
ncbi:MAG: CPBP family intramembrane glutamic endopeptidase [Methanobacterium sp.]